MGNGVPPGPIDITKVQSILDGTLCRSRSPTPGPLASLVATMPGLALPRYVYCDYWEDADRTAFWTGVADRIGELAAEVVGVLNWLRDAVGQGEPGSFEKAWSELFKGMGKLIELAFKVAVVIHPFGRWHPSYDEYAKELKDLGLNLAQDAIEGYRKAYDAGGQPQVAGRLLVDIMGIILEALLTKGAGRIMHASKLNRVLPKKLHGPPAPTKAASPFTDVTLAEIDAAVDQIIPPKITGRKKPRISGRRVPTKRGTRLDIDDLPRKANETARQALARVQTVIGKKISDSPSLLDAWNKARDVVVSKEPLSATNYAKLYDNTREEFWKNVRVNPDAKKIFSDAGFEFSGASTTAPRLRGIRPDVPVEETRVSLDHIKEKAIGQNWQHALDADNLELAFQSPNSYREIVQMRHPELRP